MHKPREAYYEIRGRIVTDVTEGTYADRIGLRPGDIVYQVNGRQVTCHDDLYDFLIDGVPPVLSVARHGKRLILGEKGVESWSTN